MLEMIDCHDLVAVQAFRKDLVHDSPFYNSLTIRTMNNMVDVLTRASKFVKPEDDRKMSWENKLT